ncbi:MAG TPA: hypothetical protein VHH73_00630 [Verrucomicrobiae bacterium]|nr:hypothetical protein [Verrucomicrobiae bacterium]
MNAFRTARFLCRPPGLTCWLVLASLLAPLPSKAAKPVELRVRNVAGEEKDPLTADGAKAIAFVFLSVECPISNSYAPKIRRLAGELGPRGGVVRLVYPNPDETPDKVRQHLKEYNLPLDAYLDYQHALTKAAGARVTPEAAVYVPGKGWVYHGRIDDRYVDFGKARPEATRDDLKEVMVAVLAGNAAPVKSAPAVGCSIAKLP